jgi:DNA mismatch repair protein MSH4
VIFPQKESIYESELAINYVLEVKSFVSAVPPLFEALSNARSVLLRRIREVCRPELVEPVVDLISTTINEDVSHTSKPLEMRHQRTYAVKVRQSCLRLNDC